MAKEIKKIVLAYSGGLDTSIIIPWLHENYPGCEVICVAGNVGQDSEIVGLEERAKKTGASKLYIEDIQDEFVNDFWPYGLKPKTGRIPNCRVSRTFGLQPTSTNVKYSIFMVSGLSTIPTCAGYSCGTTGSVIRCVKITMRTKRSTPSVWKVKAARMQPLPWN